MGVDGGRGDGSRGDGNAAVIDRASFESDPPSCGFGSNPIDQPRDRPEDLAGFISRELDHHG